MSLKLTEIRSGVGAVASMMSKFVHPIELICDTYSNRPKKHKLQGVVLVEVDAKVVRRGANAILVFDFTHANFTDQQLFARLLPDFGGT